MQYHHVLCILLLFFACNSFASTKAKNPFLNEVTLDEERVKKCDRLLYQNPPEGLSLDEWTEKVCAAADYEYRKTRSFPTVFLNMIDDRWSMHFIKLFNATSDGNTPKVHALLETSARPLINIQAVWDERYTPLHLAVVKKHLVIADLLLLNGANPDACGQAQFDEEGHVTFLQSPLMLAYEMAKKQGDYRMAALLERHSRKAKKERVRQVSNTARMPLNQRRTIRRRLLEMPVIYELAEEKEHE